MSTQAPVVREEKEAGRHPTDSSLTVVSRDRILPTERLERVPSWGESSASMGYVYRPSTVADLRDILKIARDLDFSIGLRGAGNSYGDATLNEGNIVIDFRRMNRILAWDPQEGRIQVEPGVTISQLWQYTLEDGWWPSVVPGTSKPTIGGCAAMNIHGKNAWKQGTIGDHIEEFELMLPSGNQITCSRSENERVFHSAIGGFGMLGIFTSLTLTLSQMYSGNIEVHAMVSRNLQQMMDQFEEHLDSSDYLVGWIDGFARGSRLGRGQIHKANYLSQGVDPNPQQSMRLEYQHQPDTLFLVIPRSFMWRLMRPFMNDLGTRLVNFGKYWTSRWTDGSIFRQPHVAFHFLLDYLPDWKRSYGPDGLIQYQCFIPKETAHEAFTEILTRCQKRHLTNYLTVLKRHRTDDFLITHGVDGYSMAMDFRVTRRKRNRLISLTAELDEIVLKAGGRFYLAKDSTLRPEIVKAYLGDETVETFRALKAELDPDGMFQTNLWRRLFAD